MNKKLSKTPSLLVEPRKSQPDILDDIAVADTSAVVELKNKNYMKFIYLGFFVLIIFFLLGRLFIWKKAVDIPVSSEEAAFVMSSRSLMMKIESDQDAAKISSSLLKSLGEASGERVHLTPMLVTPNSKSKEELPRQSVGEVSTSKINLAEPRQDLLPEESLLAELLGFVRQKQPDVRSNKDTPEIKQYKHVKRFDDCPAANTEAGMLCRQQLCSIMADEIGECAKSSSGS